MYDGRRPQAAADSEGDDLQPSDFDTVMGAGPVAVVHTDAAPGQTVDGVKPARRLAPARVDHCGDDVSGLPGISTFAAGLWGDFDAVSGRADH
ncbi:hypothetical protein [Streptomyces sp. NPDC058463]|uniref:hypothetical protein n=1 Tax=Streptomyces sp. NPDC058463 TaxID=3346510 RepID=UPI003669A973